MRGFKPCPACGNNFEPHTHLGILGSNLFVVCRLCGYQFVYRKLGKRERGGPKHDTGAMDKRTS